MSLANVQLEINVYGNEDVWLAERLSRGYSNGEIAALMDISHHTVEKRLYKLYKKLGCVTETASVKRAEAVGRAFRAGLIK